MPTKPFLEEFVDETLTEYVVGAPLTGTYRVAKTHPPPLAAEELVDPNDVLDDDDTGEAQGETSETIATSAALPDACAEGLSKAG